MDKITEREQGKKRTGGSFFGRLCHGFLNVMNSLFVKSHVGGNIVSSESRYESSTIGEATKKEKRKRTSRIADWVNIFLAKSKTALFCKGLTRAVMSMSVNVYAIFFTVYGITSALLNYAMMFIDWGDGHSLEGLIVSVVTVILSIPFLTSSKSLTEVVSGSLVMGKVVRSFLLIPEENLVTKKRIGSTAYMLIFAALGLLAGAATYFVHSLTAPLVFFAIVVFLVIMSFPESGVMLIAVTVPFLQYADNLKVILPILVCTTCASFFLKVWGGKRVKTRSSEGVMFSFFCILLVIGSSFTLGGWHTFSDGLYAMLFMVGGFYVTKNLMRSKEKLRVCTRALIISFGILVFMGIWDLIYGKGAAEVIKSSLNDISSLVSERVFYIADSASNFGIIACLICPILFCHACSKKSISGSVISFICFIAAIAASLIYGTYESLIAMSVGLLAYIIFKSRKSFAALLITVTVISIGIMLAVSFVPDEITNRAVTAVEDYIPVSDPQTEIQDEVERDVRTMLKDGNLSGIGVGEHAFNKTFANYSSEVSEEATGPSNLYLQIICWSGVGGLIVFIIFFVLVFKKAIGYIITSKDKEIRSTVLALTCGLASALILGMVTCLWNDVRMLYLFWMMTGLLCACVKLGREEEDRNALFYTFENNTADICVRWKK
ncbi:MAG: O-antigen ligase family protein [Ruminococcaceae bacterium]|nr:O-antigen ligase family protein [Oscillospiraceae bacterium]